MEIETVAFSALNVMVMIISILFAAGVGVGLVFIVKYLMKFNHAVLIFEEDEHGKIINVTNPKVDKGGVYIDKRTNLKLFFLKKNKVGLKPDKIPTINIGKKKFVFLVQRGLRNFSYCRFPHAISSNPGNVSLQVYDEDVSWAINAYKKGKSVFDHNTLLQYLPIISLALVSVIILILFMYLFKKFDVIAGAASSLNAAAAELAKASAGTTVVGG